MISWKSIGILCVLMLVALSFIPHSVSAEGVIDQSYNPEASKANVVNTHMPVGQSFTPSKRQLLGVDVGIDNVLVTDQSYNPEFNAPGVGYNWISYHSPIGQSFPRCQFLAVSMWAFSMILSKTKASRLTSLLQELAGIGCSNINQLANPSHPSTRSSGVST
jgi:hypothetical protein